MAAEELIKKGRKAAAAFLKAQCSNIKCPDLLNELLDIFLNPEKPISDQESIEWIEWLIAGGKTPDDFSETVKTYDSATTCGLVWTANFVAYRCRTCGISPCMSLCAECFQKGNHDGHDFNMFRSQAGGACDCGDTSVMKASGFCPRHGPKVQNEKPPVPSSLICMAEAIIPRTILRLIQHFRDAQSAPEMEETNSVGSATPFISMLKKMIEMGTAMRKVVTKALIDPEVYKLAEHDGWEIYTPPDTRLLRTKRASYFSKSYNLYEEAKASLPTCSSPPEYQHLKALKEKLEHSTFLEELMFWTVKLEFPQDLVCFLLNLLIEPDYKEAFTRTFVAHYARASVMLARTSAQGNVEHLAHRVVHVSVQLFSNEELALRMHHELRLLHVMVISLRFMVAAILTPSSLTSSRSTANNFHLVVDCTHRIMQDHTYWPLVSDLNNVLTHRQVALEFLAADDLVEMWFSFLTMFQAMNVNQREMALHLEYEPKSYYGAFSAELEASATPMWALISHLSSQESLSLTDKILKICLTALVDWFDSIDFTEEDKPSAYQMTFHLPLHRYYAMFMCQAVLQQNATLSSLLPSQSTLKMLILHPLHTLATFFEILNGLWVRNGVQIKGQSMTYIQCHFCNSMVDADIFLQQICCGHLDPDWFLETLFSQFHVWDWFSFRVHHPPSFLEPEQVMPMLEGALSLLALICSLHNNLGMSESEVTKQEMVSLLCTADRTHSQLLDMLPEKCGTLLHNKDFETILQQIADYKGPNFEIGGNMVQGTYVPKPIVWEKDFDPIHVSLRALHRKDYQASLDRYTQHIKQSGKFNSKGNLWPPYRIPGPVHPQFIDPRNILHSKTFHAIIFILLYRAFNEHEIPDKIISLTIHLLELAVKHPYSTEASSGSAKVMERKEEVPDMKFHDWFLGNKTLDNVFTSIKSVAIPQPPHPMEDMDYNENITEQSEPEALEEDVDPMPKESTHKREQGDQEMDYEASSNGHPDGTKLKEADGKEELWMAAEDRSQPLIVDVDESIVSLLLKLHSKYTGKADSFRLKRGKEREDESRIGDAPHFIGLILSHLASLYGDQTVQAVQQQIWPWRVADSPVPLDPVQDRKDIENRRRLARERQQKVMEEFAIKQKVFMQAMETELSEAEAALLPSQREYECVICSQPNTSTPERPIAMVVLVQATSTLGHSRLHGQEGLLPLDDVPLNNFTRSSYYDRVIRFLAQNCDESSWQMGINIGWKGGVHIQSCGHYLHMDCHQSYLESLRSQNARQQNLAVDRGEYACPLCRQLANSVLPIIVQQPPSPSASGSASLEDTAWQISRQLNAQPQLVSDEFGNVATFMEDVTKITDSQFRSYIPEPTQNSLFLFVCSLARINLEIDLLQKLPKKSCFVPLFRVLALHAKVLCSREPFTPLWSQLTGLPLPDSSHNTSSAHNKMPLLTKDPIALLILFSLILPAHFDKSYYTCIVQTLYNLMVVQSLARMYSNNPAHFSTLESSIESNHWLAKFLPALKPLYNSLTTTDVSPSSSSSEMMSQDPDIHIKECCLPYLRLAALLQSYLYSRPFCPDDGDNGGKGVEELCLHLGFDGGLHWPTSSGTSIVEDWVQEMIATSQSVSFPWPEYSWASPRLLRLPPHYDYIFQYYHRRPCTVCQRVPQDSAVCLVCATLVCLREKCCRQQNRYEALTHALSCGAGTAMFLLINASTIIVIRGKRACLWGSVYLDSYGEEDRDLKRGKPLFLSEARYELLEQQWLQHSFDHTNKRWVWHKDNL